MAAAANNMLQHFMSTTSAATVTTNPTSASLLHESMKLAKRENDDENDGNMVIGKGLRFIELLCLVLE